MKDKRLIDHGTLERIRCPILRHNRVVDGTVRAVVAEALYLPWKGACKARGSSDGLEMHSKGSGKYNTDRPVIRLMDRLGVERLIERQRGGLTGVGVVFRRGDCDADFLFRLRVEIEGDEPAQTGKPCQAEDDGCLERERDCSAVAKPQLPRQRCSRHR